MDEQDIIGVVVFFPFSDYVGCSYVLALITFTVVHSSLYTYLKRDVQLLG